MLRYFAKLVLIGLLVLPADGCRNPDERVPIVFVDILLLLDLPEFAPLASPGGYLEISGGSLGIVVYRRNMDDFVAFDRHCTYQVNDFCRIHADPETGITANCECCSSIFSLYDGTPIQEPAGFTLNSYRTGFNANVNQLRIFN